MNDGSVDNIDFVEDSLIDIITIGDSSIIDGNPLRNPFKDLGLITENENDFP